MATRIRLVDPILRQEELFLLMCSDEILDVAFRVIDSDLTWDDLKGFSFESFCNAALESEGVTTTHPDVPGVAVRQVLTEDATEDFILNSSGPNDAHAAGLYYWC